MEKRHWRICPDNGGKSFPVLAEEASSEAKHQMTMTETLQLGIQHAADAILLFEKQTLANQEASESERRAHLLPST